MSALVINFGSGILRICADEKIGLSDHGKTCFYHIPGDKSPFQVSGLFHVSHFYMESILKLIRPNDTLYFNIEQNGTEQLRSDGYTWEMLKVSIHRNDNYLFTFHICDEIMKSITPASEVKKEWNGIMYNIWECY